MALFSKRHYEWLARFAAQDMCSDAFYALADALEEDNDRFDRGKFIATIQGLRSRVEWTSAKPSSTQP